MTNWIFSGNAAASSARDKFWHRFCSLERSLPLFFFGSEVFQVFESSLFVSLLCCRSTPTTSWRSRLVTEGTWPSREAWPCPSSPPRSSQPSAWVRNSTGSSSVTRHALWLSEADGRTEPSTVCWSASRHAAPLNAKRRIQSYSCFFGTATTRQIHFTEADLNHFIIWK